MKQLINIKASFLKQDDLIFDLKHRDLQRVEYVFIEDINGTTESTGIMKEPHNVHVSYGEEAMSADNFRPNSTIMILIDTENIEIVEPKNIGYR